MIDSWLLEMFPGRTLEELDNMDWYRLQRAMQARHVRNIEQTRDQVKRGTLKGDKVDAPTMLEIKAHDELYARYWPE